MRRILLAMLVLCGSAITAKAADLERLSVLSQEGVSARPRLAHLRTVLAPPEGSMYSLGGYAPADNTIPEPIGPNYTQLDSPMPGACCNGACGGLWDGYQARPCYHQHHWPHPHVFFGGRGWNGPCGPCNASCCRTGSGYACGYGTGFAGVAPGCGCAPCDTGCHRHHCHLFGHCKKNDCCCAAAPTCGACGCGDSSAPALGTENSQQMPAPAPPPEPSAGRQPRRLRPLASLPAWSGAKK